MGKIEAQLDTAAPECSPKLESCIVNGEEFIRVNLDGRTVLVPAKCPHRGSPMSEAYVTGEFLVCKRHGATFDLRTGRWVRGPKCENIAITILPGPVVHAGSEAV